MVTRPVLSNAVVIACQRTARKRCLRPAAEFPATQYLPQGLMQLFQSYTGEPVTEADWRDAARSLECEIAVLKAIAQVESRGAGFWRLNSSQHGVPRI